MRAGARVLWITDHLGYSNGSWIWYKRVGVGRQSEWMIYESFCVNIIIIVIIAIISRM